MKNKNCFNETTRLRFVVQTMQVVSDSQALAALGCWVKWYAVWGSGWIHFKRGLRGFALVRGSFGSMVALMLLGYTTAALVNQCLVCPSTGEAGNVEIG